MSVMASASAIQIPPRLEQQSRSSGTAWRLRSAASAVKQLESMRFSTSSVKFAVMPTGVSPGSIDGSRVRVQVDCSSGQVCEEAAI